MSSFVPNKKLKVVLTYNVKPEEDDSFESAQDPPDSKKNNSFNDKYAEWDTFETINAIKNALEKFHNVSLIEANDNAFEKFKTAKPDIVFNVAECINGISRESQIPAMLDMLNIPYTGSDPLTLSTCLDKSRAKEVLSYHNIPNAKFQLAESLEDIDNFNLKFPVIMKPIAEGSGKGIFNSSYITNLEDLKNRLKENLETYNQPFIIEEFLPGREFTVAIIGNNSDTTILPIVEINFNELPKDLIPIYSFEAKWIADTRDNPLNIFTCPAKIDQELENKIKDIALRTYKVLRCKDWSRIDLRLDSDGNPNIIEINPLPGMLPNPIDNSCFPKAARAIGMTYEDTINRVLVTAAKRYNLL
ncbi:MAG: ATP-grasp domain-containing protein [Ignavibacteria bacterium]|nr:ATP-grasp domain-containing protein [Ignavibacteria bacterium]